MRLWLAVTGAVALFIFVAVYLTGGPGGFLLGAAAALLLALAWRLGALPGTRRSKAVRARRRLPGTPLQTTLFRAVLLALLGLFLVVAAILWWNDHRQKAEPLSGREESLVLLELAYSSQPRRYGASEGEDPLDLDGVGIWFDADAYAQITRVIEKSTSGAETLLLSGQEEQPPQSILPPSLYAKWRAGNWGDIGTPAYSFPMELLDLPANPTERDWRNAKRPWLDYIKEHGWRVGWAEGGHGRFQYALWRTGADTAEYVAWYPDDDEPDPWYANVIQWGFQSLLVYVLLTPFAAVAAWYLNRRIVRPVSEVARASRALAGGDRPDRIPEEGPAELRMMAGSFNHLALRLEQAQAGQAAFVASVSHELKTPLTSLEGYGELLADGAVEPSEAGPVVLAETARLKRLVGDLLDSARLQQEGFSVRLRPVALQRVAREVQRRYQSTAREYGVRLGIQLGKAVTGRDDDGPWVNADEDRLVQVLSNLVENAVRCSPPEGEVAIVIASSGSLGVRDTGPGLATVDLPHAFERFYLYERYGKDRPVGTGLGLAIVKELVEAMGGNVTVASEPGVGTVFAIELPPGEPTAT
jgi:signal transduction histidine kinase